MLYSNKVDDLVYRGNSILNEDLATIVERLSDMDRIKETDAIFLRADNKLAGLDVPVPKETKLLSVIMMYLKGAKRRPSWTFLDSKIRDEGNKLDQVHLARLARERLDRRG